MSDDVAGIIPDDELDEEQAKFTPPTEDFLEDEELVEVDLDALHEDVVPVEEEEFGVAADGFGEATQTDADADEDDDEEEDFYGAEDDEARYNFKADEDPLEEGY